MMRGNLAGIEPPPTSINNSLHWRVFKSKLYYAAATWHNKSSFLTLMPMLRILADSAGGTRPQAKGLRSRPSHGRKCPRQRAFCRNLWPVLHGIDRCIGTSRSLVKARAPMSHACLHC